MRAVCDVCEAAPAQLFCAADEAALCRKCDDKVHGCNKLASRHVRLELAEARSVPICDICEDAPAFFFCGIDGTSLCLQCDMDAHTGGKKTHERYLTMGQRVEMASQNSCGEESDSTEVHDCTGYQFKQKKGPILLHSESNNSHAPAVAIALGYVDMQHVRHQGSPMIDLNFKAFQHAQFVPLEDASSSEPSSDDDYHVRLGHPETNTVIMEDAVD